MRRMHFDCSFGINGYMALMALKGLGVSSEKLDKIDEKIRESIHEYAHRHEEQHEHSHGHFHEGEHHHEHEHQGRSYVEIKEIVETAGLPQKATQYALAIYETIAKAEARVHRATLETVHFHEVGRDEAICNIVKVAFCMDYLDVDEVYCGIIHDGTGFVECSHGTLPLPVPAVAAMLEDSGLVYESEPINRELVTPSGLAILIGLRAIYCEGLPTGMVADTSFAPLHDGAPDQGLNIILTQD